MEVREDCKLLSFLNSECVIVTAEQNCLFKFIVAHGRIVKHFVLMHDLAYFSRMDVANSDPELAIITNKARLVSSLAFLISTAVINVSISDRSVVRSLATFSEGCADVKLYVGGRKDALVRSRNGPVVCRVGKVHPGLNIRDILQIDVEVVTAITGESRAIVDHLIIITISACTSSDPTRASSDDLK